MNLKWQGSFAMAVVSATLLLGVSPTADAGTPRAPIAQNTLPLILVGPALSQGATDKIVGQIDNSVALCRGIQKPFVMDCLAQEFKKIERTLKKSTDYSVAYDALRQVGKELSAIAKQNADKSVKKQRFTGQNAQGKKAKTGKLIAIAPASQDKANAQARASLDRAVATLQRSNVPDAARKIHYQQIAEALDGAAILMRS